MKHWNNFIFYKIRWKHINNNKLCKVSNDDENLTDNFEFKTNYNLAVPEVKKLLDKDSFWKNPKKSIFNYKIKAGTCKNVRDVIIKLAKINNQDISSFSKSKWSQERKHFNDHVRGLRSWGFLNGFFQQDTPIGESRNINDTLFRGNCVVYFWYDLKNNCKIIPQKYTSVFEFLIDFLADKNLNVPENKMQNYINGFLKAFSGICGGYLDWMVVSEEEYQWLLDEFDFNQADNLEKTSFKPFQNNSINPFDPKSFLDPIQKWYQENFPDSNTLKNFNDFYSKTLKKNLVLQWPFNKNEREDLWQNEITNYFAVSSQKTMLNFLENSDSLYHNLVAFFIKSPIPQIFEKHQIHHIIPLYLSNYEPNLNSFYLEQPYNKIGVPFIFHVFLHFIRALEFIYNEDRKTINIAYSQTNQNSDLKNYFSNMITIFTNAIENDSLLENQATNMKNFEAKRDTYWLDNMNDYQKKFFSYPFKFHNLQYDIPEPSFDLTNCKENKDILDRLLKVTEDYFNSHPDKEKPPKWDHSRKIKMSYLRKYLTLQEYLVKGPLFGWVLSESQADPEYQYIILSWQNEFPVTPGTSH